MPHFRLETNLPKDKIPATFASELRKVISQVLGDGKPEEITAVTIIPDQLTSLGNVEGPCGQASLLCFGKFSPEANQIYSKAIAAKIAEIGIPADRMFIFFQDCKSYEIGFGGTTAAALGL